MIKGLFPHDIDKVLLGEMTFLERHLFLGKHDKIGNRHFKQCAKNGYIELFSWLLRLHVGRYVHDDKISLLTGRHVAQLCKDELMTVPCDAADNHQWEFFMYLVKNDLNNSPMSS